MSLQCGYFYCEGRLVIFKVAMENSFKDVRMQTKKCCLSKSSHNPFAFVIKLSMIQCSDADRGV